MRISSYAGEHNHRIKADIQPCPKWDSKIVAIKCSSVYACQFGSNISQQEATDRSVLTACRCHCDVKILSKSP